MSDFSDYMELLGFLRDENNCDVLDYIDDAANAIEDLIEENRKLEWRINALSNELEQSSDGDEPPPQPPEPVVMETFFDYIRASSDTDIACFLADWHEVSPQEYAKMNCDECDHKKYHCATDCIADYIRKKLVP